MFRVSIALPLAPVAALAVVVAGCTTPTAETAAHGTSAATTSPPATSSPLGVFTSDASGFDTHSFWYDTGEEVVVFDAQFTEPLATQAIAQIQRTTASPIRYVVITHPNPDKFNGVGPFRAAGATIVASASTASALPEVYAYKKNYFVNVAKTFTDDTYPPLATVDLTFVGDFSLPLAAGCVSLHELENPGVSSTQTVAFIPDANALVVGDLVNVGVHGWLEGGIVAGAPVPTLDSWKLALDEIGAYGDATVYGGRGNPAPLQGAIADEKAYLDGMGGLVATYVGSLGSASDAQTELLGPNAGTDWAALTTLAEQAYPDRSLSYLITYGVYGLADQLAANE